MKADICLMPYYVMLTRGEFLLFVIIEFMFRVPQVLLNIWEIEVHVACDE